GAGAEVRLVPVPSVVVAERRGLEVEQIRSLSHISLRVAPSFFRVAPFQPASEHFDPLGGSGRLPTGLATGECRLNRPSCHIHQTACPPGTGHVSYPRDSVTRRRYSRTVA